MGQEESKIVDESVVPERLESRTIKALAKYIKDGKAKKIVVMTGAGISTSAGIPDFRSPETGLYANLARLNLPYPEAVFELGYFREKPEPFYTLAHELYPGKYRPTITHSFIALLHEKGLLHMLFTQNIDCLEREAGVPDEKVVEAHGSFATQRCIDCKTEYPDDMMRKAIESKFVPTCINEQCKGLVKPDIVFFGEQLPAKFFENRLAIPEAELILILGTSLQVAPFSQLPQFASEGVPRLLINMEQVGGIGSRPDDVLLLGDCDEGTRKLASELGWLEELETKWATTAPKEAEQLRKATTSEEPPVLKSKDDALLDEIDKLTRYVDQALKTADERTERYSNSLDSLEKKAEQQLSDVRQVKEPGLLGTEGGPQAVSVVSQDNEHAGLQHVFPHLKGKSTL